ncbi:hypothetical protein ACET3Z_008007 [Daucus carota]
MVLRRRKETKVINATPTCQRRAVVEFAGFQHIPVASLINHRSLRASSPTCPNHESGKKRSYRIVEKRRSLLPHSKYLRTYVLDQILLAGQLNYG